MITCYDITMEIDELPSEMIEHDIYNGIYYIIAKELVSYLKENKERIKTINISRTCRDLISTCQNYRITSSYYTHIDIIKYINIHKFGIQILEMFEFRYNDLYEIPINKLKVEFIKLLTKQHFNKKYVTGISYES